MIRHNVSFLAKKTVTPNGPRSREQIIAENRTLLDPAPQIEGRLGERGGVDDLLPDPPEFLDPASPRRRPGQHVAEGVEIDEAVVEGVIGRAIIPPCGR
jgi:hypothetical protein